MLGLHSATSTAPTMSHLEHIITVFIVSLEVDESEKPSHAQSIQRGILQTIRGIDRN